MVKIPGGDGKLPMFTGKAKNLEALPPLLKLENIFVLCPYPPVRVLKSNAKFMSQEKSCSSRNQFFYYPTPMPSKKHCTKKDLLVHVLVALVCSTI